MLNFIKKKSNTEVGHIQNLHHFQHLLNLCKEAGSSYQPGNSELSLAQLEPLYQQAALRNEALQESKAQYSKTLSDRSLGFEPLKRQSSQILNLLQSMDVGAETISSFTTYHRKLRGVRAKRILNNDMKTVSVSQQSFPAITTVKTKSNLVQNESNKKSPLLGLLCITFCTNQIKQD